MNFSKARTFQKRTNPRNKDSMATLAMDQNQLPNNAMCLTLSDSHATKTAAAPRTFLLLMIRIVLVFVYKDFFGREYEDLFCL